MAKINHSLLDRSWRWFLQYGLFYAPWPWLKRFNQYMEIHDRSWSLNWRDSVEVQDYGGNAQRTIGWNSTFWYWKSWPTHTMLGRENRWATNRSRGADPLYTDESDQAVVTLAGLSPQLAADSTHLYPTAGKFSTMLIRCLKKCWKSWRYPVELGISSEGVWYATSQQETTHLLSHRNGR